MLRRDVLRVTSSLGENGGVKKVWKIGREA